MAFNNFSQLISRHKRSFLYSVKQAGSRDPISTRYIDGDYIDYLVQGTFETITKDDLDRFPDYEIHAGDMKLTATPTMLGNLTPKIGDRIAYNNEQFDVNRIKNQIHYGKYYLIFLRKVVHQNVGS